METLTAIFAYLCGQGRPFMIDGAPLPVCQRCLGLYAGATMTAAWLVASGVWRRGLPDRRTMWLHTAMLMAAMLGGMHLFDPGPAWRLVCGLWTGHVAMLWLVGGAVELRSAVVVEERDHSRAHTAIASPAAFLLAGPTLAILAVLFSRYVHAGWYIWTAVAAVGAVLLAAALSAAAAMTARWIIRVAIRWTARQPA